MTQIADLVVKTGGFYDRKKGILLIDSSLLFAHSKSKKNISLWITVFAYLCGAPVCVATATGRRQTGENDKTRQSNGA